MALHIKKGDTVQIISGDHKGATGKVLRVLPRKNSVVIQGQNLVKKHVRPSRKSPQGGRLNIEKPIHMSNVLPVNPKSSKATRVSYRINKDGTKERLAGDGSVISTVRRANK